MYTDSVSKEISLPIQNSLNLSTIAQYFLIIMVWWSKCLNFSTTLEYENASIDIFFF